MMEREKLAGLIAKLDAVKVGHCDWAGYLVHRSDPTQQQLEYDQHCPACVIKAVKAELSQLLSELDAPAAPPASDKPVSECEVCGGTITHKANCLNGNSPLRLATLGEIEYLSDCSPAHGPYPGQQIQSESSAASAAPAAICCFLDFAGI